MFGRSRLTQASRGTRDAHFRSPYGLKNQIATDRTLSSQRPRHFKDPSKCGSHNYRGRRKSARHQLCGKARAKHGGSKCHSDNSAITCARACLGQATHHCERAAQYYRRCEGAPRDTAKSVRLLTSKRIGIACTARRPRDCVCALRRAREGSVVELQSVPTKTPNRW